MQPCRKDTPIIYKKETPNQKSAIETGKNLLKAFYEGIDLTGFEMSVTCLCEKICAQL
jgi:hypothetical protein